MEEILKKLKLFGLSDNESKVYTILLRDGNSKIQEISKKTGILRTSLYVIIDSLIKKGIVQKEIKKKISHFKACDPQVMIEILKNNIFEINSIIPKIKEISKPIQKKDIEMFQGKQSILSIISDIIKSKTELWIYGGYSPTEETDTNFNLFFRKSRLEAKIKAKIIIPPTKDTFYKKKSYQKLTQLKENKSLINLKTITFIYGNKVAIYTRQEPIIGILLENTLLVQREKELFKNLWKNSKSLTPITN